MSSSVKDPILIESDDEDEEVVYIGTSQKSPEVVDVEAIRIETPMETYTVIDVDEQPDIPDGSPGVAMDCDQFSTPTEGSLEAGSQALDPTLLDISQATLPPHSNGADLLSSSHLGLDPLGTLDPLDALDPNGFSLSPAGMGLDATSMGGHRTSSVVTGGAADLTNTTHNSVAVDLTSGILDPTSSSFGAQDKNDFSLKAPLQGSLPNLGDVSSALDLRQQAMDLTVPRSDAAPLTGPSKPSDLNFPDSMTIYPSFYVDDDKSSFLFGSGSTALTNIPQNGYAVSNVNIAPSQNLPMATSVTCPPVAAPLPHSLKASTPPPATAVLTVPTPVPASRFMALCTQASPPTDAFSQYVQNSSAQSSTQGMASLQSTSASQLPFLNPTASQSSLLVAVPVSSVHGGFLPVPPLPAPLSSLSGSTTAGPLGGTHGASLGPLPQAIPAIGRDTTDLLSVPPASTGVFWSSSGGGMMQGSSVSSVTNTVVVTAADSTSASLPVGARSVPRGSTTSQASALCGVSSSLPTCSNSPFGLQAIGQRRTSNSLPSTSGLSSGPNISFPLSPSNAASSSSVPVNAGGCKDRKSGDGWDVLDLIGDLFQLDSNKSSSTGNTSASQQASVVSSGASAGVDGGMAPAKTSDPRQPIGVDVPSSQSGCGNTSTSLGGSAPGMSSIQVQPSIVMNSSPQTSSVPIKPVKNFFPGGTALLSVSVPLRYANHSKSSSSSTSQFLSVVPSLASPSVFTSSIPGAPVTINVQVGSSPSGSVSVSSSSSMSGSTLGMPGNQPSSSGRLPMNILPLRKRKYPDVGLGSSGGGSPAKRPKSRDRMLCAGCYVSTRDWDRVLQCPQGHLACSSCLHRQNILFLQNKVEKLSCFDVTCSHIFGNNLVQSMVGTEGEKREEGEENEEDSFVTSSVNKSLETPLHWAPMKEKTTRSVMVDLIPASEEYNHVVAMFRESLRFKVKKVLRVQNPGLWRYYNMKKVEMTQDHQDIVEERLLFHGTKDTGVLQNICEKGFDWRYCGKHGTLYGHGSYFAAKADYSHQYCTTNRNRLRGALGGSLFYMPPPAHLNINNFSRLLCGSCLTRGNSLSFATPPNPPTLLQVGPPQTLSMALGSSLGSSFSVSTSSSSNIGSGSNSSSSVPFMFQSMAPLNTSGTAGQGSARSITTSMLSAAASSSSLPGPVGFPSGSSAPSNGPALVGPTPIFSPQANPGCTSPIMTRYQRLMTKAQSLNNRMKKLMMSNMSSVGNSSGTGSSSTAPTSSSVPTSSSSSTFSSAFPSISSQLIAALGPPPLPSLPPPPPLLPPLVSPPQNPLSASSCAEEEGPVLKMLVAKVLVGKYTRGSKDLRKPPPQKEDDPFGKDYDSCVDNMVDPSIHVVFDSKQTYPMWVIEYVEEYE